MNSHEVSLEYFLTGQVTPGCDQVFYVTDRGEIKDKLNKFIGICKTQGLDDDTSYSVTALIGELINNCFDHNLGFWKETPGCCLSWSQEKNILTFCIADRGRGIIESLRQVAGPEKLPQVILKMAFEEIISGRAPEKRGNGLKFVRKFILSNINNSLKCFSNDCEYQINNAIFPIPLELPKKQNFGTLIYFQWRIK